MFSISWNRTTTRIVAPVVQGAILHELWVLNKPLHSTDHGSLGIIIEMPDLNMRKLGQISDLT